MSFSSQLHILNSDESIMVAVTHTSSYQMSNVNYLISVHIVYESVHRDNSTCMTLEDRNKYHRVDLVKTIWESVIIFQWLTRIWCTFIDIWIIRSKSSRMDFNQKTLTQFTKSTRIACTTEASIIIHSLQASSTIFALMWIKWITGMRRTCRWTHHCCCRCRSGC